MKNKSWLIWLVLLAGLFIAINRNPLLFKQVANSVETTTAALKTKFSPMDATQTSEKNSDTAKTTNGDATPLESSMDKVSLSNTYYYTFKKNVPDSAKQVFEDAVNTYNNTGLVKIVPGKGSQLQNQITFFVYHKKSDNALSSTIELGYGGPTVISWNSLAVNHSKAGLNLSYPNLAIKQSVATHELGHALGLDHSSDKSSVMYPIDQGMTTLSSGDVLGLKEIYAKK